MTDRDPGDESEDASDGGADTDTGATADTAGETGPFLLDVMLGKLATYLRMCGYDAAYALDRVGEDDAALLDLAREEGRVLVTRDAQLAGRADDAVLLESHDIEGKLRELRAAGVPLALDERPSRCGRCNGSVERVSPGEQTPDYAPATDVWRCRDCGQYFWKGSHWDRVAETLAGIAED